MDHNNRSKWLRIANIEFFSALEEAKTNSVAATAAKHAIPRSTLRDRKKGSTNARDAQIKHQKLDKDQEKFLCNWILNEEDAGRAPSKKNIRDFAQMILKYDSQDSSVGHHWVNRFIDRHEDIKTKLSRPVDAVRTRSTSEEALRDFYEVLARQIQQKNIRPSTLHNVDEHGVAEGETKHGKVVGSSYTRYSVVAKSDSHTWVSILECISAAGTWIKPLVIFTGDNLQGQWFDDPPYPDWLFESSAKGWSTSHIFYLWFRDNFLPNTAVSPGGWRLLILDNHSTHVTVEVMFLAWINKVQLLYLPKHSSHITQPLDVGIFSVAKQFFHEETARFATFEARSPIQKRWFIRAYEVAHRKVMTPRNIIHAFRGAGIWPVNIDKPLSKVVEPTRPPSLKTPPQTSHKRKGLHDQLLCTPKNSREVRARLEAIEKSVGTVQRNLRVLIQQTGKQISRLNAINAGKTQEIEFMKLTEESKKPTGRKPVDYNSNERFARIPEIAMAHFQSENAPAVVRDREAPKLQENSISAASKGAESLMNIFQYQPN